MKVIVVSGPTATGKTSVSLQLASQFGGEIVNFDSLLLYKEINIGTAKPTAPERASVPHHLLDVASIASPLNAADYAKLALPVVQKLLADKKIVYLVGGSGFYLQALLKGMYDSPTTPKEVIERSDKLYADAGILPFIHVLKEQDPVSHTRYHENDHYRIRRAVEHLWATGRPFSAERQTKDEANRKLPGPTVHGWEVLHLHLDLPKEDHLSVITERTDGMLNQGLLEEVKYLLDQGFTGLEKPLQCIGYKEVLDLQFGVYKSLAECRERIIISTRQLAKSQRTWFKKDPTKRVFHPVNQLAELRTAVGDFLN